MTKNELFKQFIEDPILIEKGYLTDDEKERIRIDGVGLNVMIKVIQLAITNIDEAESKTVRSINNLKY